MKELLVLCAHEPTVDPRIAWAARAAQDAGFKVWIHGWTAGQANPKAKDPEKCQTTRGSMESPRKPRLKVLREAVSLVNPILLALLAPVVLVAGVLWIVFRLILAPWVILDYAMEKLRVERQTTRRVEAGFSLVRHYLFHAANWLTGGFLLRMAAGLAGYRWYLLEHAVDSAGALLSEIERRGHAPDVIHANDPDTLLSAALVKKLYGTRVVYDAHEFGPDAYLMEPRPRAIFFMYERLMLDHVDAAVTVTPQIAQKFNRLYVESTPFHVVPNATPQPCAAELEPLDDPEMEAAAKGRVRFLFQGGYAVNRGVEQVIDEFCTVDEDKAVLFLRGPDNKYREKLIAHAEKTGRLGSSIFFLASIAEDRLIASAVNADVGLIPYRSNVENHLGACPNKLSQYMQAGIMVIANRLPFVAGVVESANCGLLYDDTVDGDLASQMRKAIENANLRAQLGVNGQLYARHTYNYETYFPALQGLYEGRVPDQTPPHAGTESGQIDQGELEDFIMTVIEETYQKGLEATDPEKAFTLFKQAADAEHADAQFMVGTLYQSGRGVEASNATAAEWYARAAEGGNPRAEFNLAILLQEGLGVEKNLPEAMRRYQIAAEAGIPTAAYNLAALHYAHEPDGRQPGVALQWYAVATRLGEARGADGVHMCLKAMRIDEILGGS